MEACLAGADENEEASGVGKAVDMDREREGDGSSVPVDMSSGVDHVEDSVRLAPAEGAEGIEISKGKKKGGGKKKRKKKEK